MKVALVVCFLATQAICLRNRGFVQDTPLVLEWEFDKDYIDVEIIWNSKSFVSLQLGSKMAKTDFWVCSQEANDSAWRVADYWYPKNHSGRLGTPNPSQTSHSTGPKISPTSTFSSQTAQWCASSEGS